MNYREHLQETIRDIWKVYDRVGGMRDGAFNKEPFNVARSALYAAAIALSDHDNSLTVSQAKTEK